MTATQPNNQNRPATSPTDADTPVDLVATARAAQQLDERTPARGSGAVKLIAPAKVNLYLGIGGRRADGYHDATSILHAVNLHDILYLRLLPGAEDASGLTVHVETSAREGLEPLDVPSENNIAHKAIAALAGRLGRNQHETVEVHIEKHIPAQAGLGGGSSDAAAALLGAAHLWGVNPNDPLLEEVAHALGSDVAFFLHGGCACFNGAGEHFERTLTPLKKSLVLMKPAAGVSTAEAYRTFDKHPQPLDVNLAAAAATASSAVDVPLFNNLAPASELLLPELTDVRTWATEQPGVEGVLLCGSGSSTFAVCSDVDAALRLSVAARQRGWWARTTAFGSLRAAVVPA
ncbi:MULTISPECIES: 4-(cytidine 5'-diphospho)-2-C-methyl-D-erythritol kinase [Gordonibacter]|uniref:4-diphosphocytidyl-2-C-methyl-D-erythritol kinase n=1 Tax=Gordonibacter faecis TaxID=3047475 RepID=A0ABT7DKE8_9ACTN|nr:MULTISPECIES: 4-(cytidine 5'-diphospho)-2-C-methyl-D-erythritol kinase [unclassified Gordonibacter]MDJ1650006.1 4-(cytidine 5'-diphospho)-2-C-methyl-D-erythritol kinase [Gordonibacter sp. KGMB12511]